MYKKIILALAIAFTSVLVNPQSASSLCLYDSVMISKYNKAETLAQWIARQKLQLNQPSCFTDSKILSAMYNKLKPTAEAIIAQSSKTEFDKRFESCNKGNGSSLNPKTWANIMKCTFTVAFFPTANPLKEKFNATINTLKSNQPISYIPIANKMVKNVKDNWGGTDCTAGDIDFSVRLAGLSAPWKFVIPCKPASPLQIFRNFMVIAVWLGFMFWLYRQGSTFLKERG